MIGKIKKKKNTQKYEKTGTTTEISKGMVG